LSDIDSAFQLQEYIAQVIKLDPHNVQKIVLIPGSNEKDLAKDSSALSQSSNIGLGLGINMDSNSGPEETREHEREGSSSGVDEACWIYEHLRYCEHLAPKANTKNCVFIIRRLAQDLTDPLVTTLQNECTRATCPDMKAGEWLYLCVAHGTGTSGAMEVIIAIFSLQEHVQ
jgi:hypothetical protein